MTFTLKYLLCDMLQLGWHIIFNAKKINHSITSPDPSNPTVQPYSLVGLAQLG